MFAQQRIENGVNEVLFEQEFQHQFKYNNTFKVQYQKEANNIEREPDIESVQPCFNCGKAHPDDDCNFPTYYDRCPRCWIVSFDKVGHRPPCAPVNTVSRIRSNILGRIAIPMFKFRVLKSKGELFYMSPIDMAFKIMDDIALLSPPTCGVFNYKNLEKFHMINFAANMYTRFSFLIAIYNDGKWRLRFRAIVSPTNGLLILILKLKKTVGPEDVYSSKLNNTVAVFGMKPRSTAMDIDFRCFAGDYTGSINWRCLDGKYDETQVDDILDGKTPKTKKTFNSELYDKNFEALSMAEQEMDFDEGFDFNE